MKKMKNEIKHIKNLGFYFVGTLKFKSFLLGCVTDVESSLLVFTGKSSESFSRMYIFALLILLHNKCSPRFLCYVQFSYYIYCDRLISFFIVS